MPLDLQYPLIYKASYFMMAVPTLLVIIISILSSKEMGGTLGSGLKKVALGTIIDSIQIIAYIFSEKGIQWIVDGRIRNFFFLGSAVIASVFLFTGFYQIYKITKKLKLSSP